MQIYKQKGISLIGFLLITALVCSFAIVGFRLTPAYLQHFSVVQALNGMAQNIELTADSYDSKQLIRKAVQRRLDINDVDAVRARDLTIEQVRSGYKVTAQYNIKISIIGNLDVLLKFNDSVQVKYSGQ